MINRSERPPRTSDVPGTLIPLGPRHARPAAPHLSTARAAVLRALVRAGDAVTVATLADRLGQHPNTVREHLDALLAAGQVERLRSAPAGRGRPAWLYQASDSGTRLSDVSTMRGAFTSDGQEYAALALALIDQVACSSPDPRGMARQAGERWGRSLAEQAAAAGGATTGEQTAAAGSPVNNPSAAVTRLLTDLRFESRSDDAPTALRLTTCPFLDAARRNPEVVCQVHLGIVRGALEHFGGDPDAADLTAFAEPGACVLTLPGAAALETPRTPPLSGQRSTSRRRPSPPQRPTPVPRARPEAR